MSVLVRFILLFYILLLRTIRNRKTELMKETSIIVLYSSIGVDPDSRVSWGDREAPFQQTFVSFIIIYNAIFD